MIGIVFQFLSALVAIIYGLFVLNEIFKLVKQRACLQESTIFAWLNLNQQEKKIKSIDKQITAYVIAVAISICLSVYATQYAFYLLAHK